MSLKARIDDEFEAQNWDVVQLPKQVKPNTILTTYLGAVPSGTASPAHRVEVQYFTTVGRDQTDAEDAVSALLALLDGEVRECYPNLAEVTADYPDRRPDGSAVRTGPEERWCVVSVECRDRGPF